MCSSPARVVLWDDDSAPNCFPAETQFHSSAANGLRMTHLNKPLGMFAGAARQFLGCLPPIYSSETLDLMRMRLLTFVALLAFAAGLRADEIRLKDGSKIVG